MTEGTEHSSAMLLHLSDGTRGASELHSFQGSASFWLMWGSERASVTATWWRPESGEGPHPSAGAVLPCCFLSMELLSGVPLFFPVDIDHNC